MRWPKYWSFSFSISPSNEHPGLISFRMDWLDLAGHTLGNCPAGVIGQSLEIFLSVVSSVQLLSCVQLFVTPCTAVYQASLSITNSWSLLKPMSIELVMPSNHLILCCPLLLLPSIFPSIRVFSNESAVCIRWPKYWSFSFNISPSNEHPGLISFRMNWLDNLAVQGTLKSLLQHSSKASFFLRLVVQLCPSSTNRRILPVFGEYEGVQNCFWCNREADIDIMSEIHKHVVLYQDSAM